MNTALWIAQSLLAVLFLIAGTMKLAVPMRTSPSTWAGPATTRPDSSDS